MITVMCPKCTREAEIVFDFISGQKLIRCPCGNIGPTSDLNFNPEPNFLYKYRSHDRYSESWILNEELFFASPAVFNDPFDSKVMHTFEGTLEQKRKYLSEAMEIKFPTIRKEKRSQIINHALENNFLENDYDGHAARMQKKIDDYGVVSFSRKRDDLLMFAYYAKDHTGYCLKYRRSAENVLSFAREIVYEEFYPKFSPFDFGFEKMGSFGDKILLTKARCWAHEDEWRISTAELTQRVIKSPHPILTGIILGCKMNSHDRAEIIDLNKRRSNPVEMFEARKKKFEFALEILPIET